ncbi:hypothetical protein HY629_01640, partial [Candidatus Uhrbacteria bacterium]|nr:hypothetical protein [Candidatus Uhrbacteria bacterium]
MNDEAHNPKPEEPEIEVLPVKTQLPSAREDAGGGVQRGKQNIIIGTLNVFADPARGAFIEPIERRYWRHYHPDRPHAKRHVVVDVLLFAALVGLVAFNVAVYVGFGRSYLPGIQLTITHEGVLVSGGPAQYAIHYTNDNAGRLEDVRLALRLPAALTEVSVTPENGFNRNTNTWSLGAIDPGGDATLTVRGHVLGSIGEAVNVGATLSYRPEGSRRGEQKLILDHGMVERSTLTTSTEGPPQHINGQSITLRFSYKNEGESATPPLLMTPTLPEGFVLTRATPPLQQGSVRIDRVPPNGEGVIVFDGVLDGRGQSAIEIPVAVALVYEGRTLSQGDARITVPVFYPRLTTTLTIDAPSLRPGGETTYTVAYVNEEEGDVLDVQLTIVFPEGLIDAGTFSSAEGVRDGSTVRFAKARVPALALVKPGGKGTLAFTVATRQDIDARILFPNQRPRVTIPVTATYRLEPDVDTIIPVTRSTEFPVSAG